jgi:hypothetical protein
LRFILGVILTALMQWKRIQQVPKKVEADPLFIKLSLTMLNKGAKIRKKSLFLYTFIVKNSLSLSIIKLSEHEKQKIHPHPRRSKIYRDYYNPSFNIFRWLNRALGIYFRLVSCSNMVMTTTRKMPH